MRTVLLTLLFITLINCRVGAQITLTAADYPASLIGTDSLRITTYSTPFPSLLAAAGGSWDMAAVSDTTPVFFTCRVPVATYQYADSNYYNIGSFAYQGNTPSSVTSIGLYEYGISAKYVAYSLTSITTGPTDTLYIPAQSTVYTSPLVKIALPATFNTTWQSVYRNDVAIELSVAAYFLLHTPGIVRTYTDRKDTVTGWGKMRVKNAAGLPSEYFEVLQVQSTTITVDSFFLGGVPASGGILSVLSLAQGQRDTTYIQRYYRADEVTPLAKVEFRDVAFTQPYKGVVHMQRLVPVTLRTGNIDAPSVFSVYPNPVSSRKLNINLPVANKDYAYMLCDVTGRQVQSGMLELGNNEFALRFGDYIGRGVYYLRVMCGGTSLGLATITVVE